MPIRCLIVEDEPMARKLLEQYVTKAPGLELMAALSNPLAALEFLKDNQPDLLFLDVQMPELTGIGRRRRHRPHGADPLLCNPSHHGYLGEPVKGDFT